MPSIGVVVVYAAQPCGEGDKLQTVMKRGLVLGTWFLAIAGASAGGCALLAGIEDLHRKDDGTILVAADQCRPKYIEVRDEYIYWTNSGDGAGCPGQLMRASKHGGPSIPLGSGSTNPTYLALGSEHAMWSDLEANTVYWVNRLDGGGVGHYEGGSGAPWDLAVTTTHLYVAINTDEYGKCGAVVRVQLGTDTPDVAVVHSLNGPAGIVVDSSHVYWTETGDAGVCDTAGSVVRKMSLNNFANDGGLIAVDSGLIDTIADVDNMPHAIALSGAYVFWVALHKDTYTGQIWRKPVQGGSEQRIAFAERWPADIVTDGTYLYWTNAVGGEVVMADLDGDNRRVLVSGQAGPWGIAVDDEYVYWTNNTGNEVWKIRKPD